METRMNDGKQTFTEKEVIMIAINQLTAASLPGSVIAALAPDQIMAIKQQLLDPVEGARRNMIELYRAHENAEKQAAEAAAQAEEPEIQFGEMEEIPEGEVPEGEVPEDVEIIEIAPAE